jgi:hypothetical protein
MPVVSFSELPANGRVWIFASDRPLRGDDAASLLAEVDRFLAQWKAHGAPLRSGREWRNDRFLVIGVDPTAEQASGCSIDGLFRGLQELERSLATRLVGGGRVFYRDRQGNPALASRADAASVISHDTPVFDTSLTDVAGYRARFERPAADTWVAVLLTHSSQPSSRSATNSSSVKKG